MSKKARTPQRAEDSGRSEKVIPIVGSYDQEDPAAQMKAIKEALDAYFSAETETPKS